MNKSKLSRFTKRNVVKIKMFNNISKHRCQNLKTQVTASELEQNIKFNKSSMREAISSLIGQANR